MRWNTLTVAHLPKPSLTMLMLLNHGANPDAAPGQDSPRCPTALYEAIDAGGTDCVEILLKHGADPNSLSGGPGHRKGTTPLCRAAQVGDVRMIELLVKHGAELDPANCFPAPLGAAAAAGRAEAVALLLRLGTAPEQIDAAFRAAAQSAAGILGAEAMLRNGVEADYRSAEGTPTALYHAASLNNAAMARLLLSWGADESAETSIGTPLHVAADYCFAGMVEVLIEAGASVNRTDPQGRTPLDLALANGSDGQETVGILAKHGAQRGTDLRK